MRIKKEQRLFNIPLEFPNNLTRNVKVRASTREVAESRALKRNPGATGIARRA